MVIQNKTACPKCQKNLSEFALSPQLSVSRCEGCSLLWFDAGEIGSWFRIDELETINFAMNSGQQTLSSRPHGQNSNADYICPRCSPKERLRALELKDQILYRCFQCMGHMVSTEGLKKFKRYILPNPKEASMQSSHESNGLAAASLPIDLRVHSKILIKQRRELAELVGIETRNKYDIYGSDGKILAFAAEQGKGALSMISRYLLGHWRRFQIQVFTPSGTLILTLDHPFKFFLSRLEVLKSSGEKLGTIAQNFKFLSKKLTVFDSSMNERFVIKSPIWRPWRFPIYRDDQEVGVVEKKFTGLFTEVFTDKDSFLITIHDAKLSEEDRLLSLASSLLIDLIYFEKKG